MPRGVVITAQPGLLCYGIWGRKGNKIIVPYVNPATVCVFQDSHTLVHFSINIQGVLAVITDRIFNLISASLFKPQDLDE